VLRLKPPLANKRSNAPLLPGRRNSAPPPKLPPDSRLPRPNKPNSARQPKPPPGNRPPRPSKPNSARQPKPPPGNRPPPPNKPSNVRPPKPLPGNRRNSTRLREAQGGRGTRNLAGIPGSQPAQSDGRDYALIGLVAFCGNNVDSGSSFAVCKAGACWTAKRFRPPLACAGRDFSLRKTGKWAILAPRPPGIREMSAILAARIDLTVSRRFRWR